MKTTTNLRILWLLGSIACAWVSFLAGHRLGAGNAAAPEADQRERATGVGGIFFRAKDPKALEEWYARHLGIKIRTFEGQGSCPVVEWRELDVPENAVYTVWRPFKEDTKYFGPGGSQFMINYRVRNLDAMLAQLRAAGVEVVGGPQDWFNGRFAWIIDPDGRRVELWEPAEGH